MKNKILILVFALIVAAVGAQQDIPKSKTEKGISPQTISNQQTLANNTYAVVVGISDYQDPGIPDLRFADKDAEAFANFLRSKAGGSVHSDNLQLLTNTQATAGRIAEALDAIIEKAKKDDLVIIYFSGHGDVEGKKLTQPGFLLCWDAPSRVYMGGGTYSLSFLQEVVSTLSIQNQAKVVVITDACHAGKLAGSQIGGAQLTTSNLAKQYANEVKILSCQPNEFSLEGPQWGGGRGVFSYHLVDGLYGLADRNNDGQVTLGEIDRYLEDHVTAEAAPQSQVPILLGNKTDRMANVNSNILADLRKNKSLDMSVFASIESRGFEEEILSKADTNIQFMYKAFKQAVAQKRFLYPENDCAEKYYVQLEQLDVLAPLRGIMKRNYAAALQDDAQQVLNRLLISDPTIYGMSVKLQANKYELFPKYLERSAELLGEKHYLYFILMARMNFFKGYLLQLSNVNFNKNIGLRSIEYFNKAILLQEDFPLPYWQLSNVYGRIFNKLDSTKYYSKRAMDLQPNWLLPYLSMAIIMDKSFKQFEAADQYFELANQIDSNSAIILNGRGVYYEDQNEYLKAEVYYKKAVLTAPQFVYPYRNLGYIYMERKRFVESEEMFRIVLQLDSMNEFAITSLATLYLNVNQFAKSETYYVKALKIDSSAINFQNLGFFYVKTKKYKQAEQYFIKAIQLDSSLAVAFSNLGFIQKETKRFNEAEKNLKTAIQLDPNLAIAYLNLGSLQKETKRFNEAENNLKKAIELDPSADAYNGLGSLYLINQQFNVAEIVLNKAIQLDSLHKRSINDLGYLYYITGRLKESEVFFQLAYKIDPTDNYALNCLACLYSKFNQVDKAFTYLNLALEQGWNNIEQLENDDDLLLLRNQKEKWNALMKKYFPEIMK
ncbi:MAG: tetratricopeptide repeat protein [Saprospiraceae bacterium]|uniref:Tetratricopeptide repeat protein n=1 Tax=Candidatus Defluviibacterium haderslevense TaxID=2981993 RepID=A0A9D7SBL7_9BACT|nr:tetratricopeptide repeat protein [Candidatus Defluviibacterium haderslevense]